MSISEVAAVPEWTLGERLAKARRSAGLSTTVMAQRLGFKSKRTVERYEADQQAPMDAVVLAWASHTGVPIGWLRYGSLGPHTPGRRAGDGAWLRGRDSNSQPNDHLVALPHSLPAAA